MSRSHRLNGGHIAALLAMIDGSLDYGLHHIVAHGVPVPHAEFEELVALRTAFTEHFNITSPEPECLAAYREICQTWESIKTVPRPDGGTTFVVMPGPGKKEIH